MAFVNAGASAPLLRTSAYTGDAVTSVRASRVVSARRNAAATRMLIEDGEVTPTKGSKWKENLFTGGIPGGEQFYKEWIEKGMTAEFQDMPDRLQPTAPERKKAPKDRGLLGKLDATEFFSGDFVKGTTAVEEETTEEESVGTSGPIVEDTDTGDAEAPDEALFAPYFPKETRNLAPDFSFVSEGDFYKDRVSMAMTEVTAKASEVYFPKEMSGKAPIIDIFYAGTPTTASISVSMQDIEPLPALPAPPKAGEPTTAMVTGPGGGLKLEYVVDGDNIDVYSDPRCVDNYDAMFK